MCFKIYKENQMNRTLIRLCGIVCIFAISVVGAFQFSLMGRAASPRMSAEAVSIVGSMEASHLAAVLDDFTNQTGFLTAYEKKDDLSNFLLGCATAGNCPDVAIIPNIGVMKQLVDQGMIQPLDTVIPDFDTYYTATWRALGSDSGVLYGLPLAASSKSMVWFGPQNISTIALNTPGTWTDLLGLADQLVTAGDTPFAIGAESDAASGWPLTDIFENILVRVAGPEAHRKLVSRELAWTDPLVQEAMQRFTDIIGEDDYLVGGQTGPLTIHFFDALNMVLSEPPEASMYFGATWAGSVIDPGLDPLIDYDYFEFPQIDPQWGQPIVGGADLVILFNNKPEAQALLNYLATTAAAEILVASADGLVSPNQGVDLALYANPITRKVAQEISSAKNFLYDLDDQLPAELQAYFWSALLDFLQNQAQIAQILQGMEDQALEIQGPILMKVFLPSLARD
jgi:alpha-glucoside transport system substrate-binding protein